MEECLAIKPDLIFLWDEAWFGFARFSPYLRRRTGMGAAAALTAQLRDPVYRKQYEEFRKSAGDLDPGNKKLLDMHLLPDPDKTRIRVYQTSSTHKSMSALRQGSMILVRRPGLAHGRGTVPRGVLHPHLDIAQSADHRLARRGAAADGARRV